MNIRVEQPCPQCGGSVVLRSTDTVLTCPYCGIKNFLQSTGPFRYGLPRQEEEIAEHLLHVPYLRFKGNYFMVSARGVSYRVIDTTQLGFPVPGLPPSLGVRPQAMNLVRYNRKSPGRFLRLSVKSNVIIDKVIRLHALASHDKSTLYHRAFLGEDISFIYLPVHRTDDMLIDAVTRSKLLQVDQAAGYPLRGTSFSARWQVKFLATLCPRCGANLDGEGDCLVLSCSNCDSFWQAGNHGLARLSCSMVPGTSETRLYLGFWKISVHLPHVKIWSFADFLRRTNQPVFLRRSWHERVMSFWVPAFKLRPKIFLQAARQTTLNQWRLPPEESMYVMPNMFPVTMPSSEAEEAVTVLLAALAVNRKKIFPYLKGVKLQDSSASLVFLPCTDKNHDWLQPHTGMVIAKSVLRFGRQL